MASRPLRITASATSTLALVAAGIAATATTATADPAPVDTTLCAGTSVRTSDLTPGETVTGLTVDGEGDGVTPTGFTGTFKQVLKSAAGRNKDILLFRMEGSRITKANGDVDAGIWAGMSGSPVYDADGNLVGAVAYGYSYGTSDLAGVTPAKDILALQDSPAASAARIAVPSSVSKLAAASTPSASDDASDYRQMPQLKLPRVAVGTPAGAANSFVSKSRQLKKKYRNAVPKFAAGSAATEVDPVAAIVPGGNLATAWSRGDVTYAAVGTITAVCGDKVYAFGHPDDFDGNKATDTFHAAQVAEVQEDPIGGSYKLANIDLDPLGQITQDRLSGILGVLGQLPQETTITTNTTLDGESTQAVTHVSVPEAVASATASQIYNDVLDGLDAYVNGGEAEVSWTINYTPKGGTPASFSRSQRLSYDSYLAEQLPYEVASDVEFLQYGSDQKVTIDSITVDNELKPDYNALRISKLEYRKSTKVGKKTVLKWTTVKSNKKLTVQRGRTLPLRATLTPAGPDSVATPAVKRIDVKIDKYAAGTGFVALSGGQSYYPFDEDEFTIGMDEEDEEYYYEDEEPATLPEVLAFLKSQVRYDTIISEQTFRNTNGTKKTTRVKTPTSAVTRGSFFLNLSYKK